MADAAAGAWAAGLRALCARLPRVAADPEAVAILACQVRARE
jgi:hypothetical protein